MDQGDAHHCRPHLVQPVILCGGSGTRLWPLSRSGFPKQFLCLTGHESLFQLAAKRLTTLQAPGVLVAAPCIVGNEAHRFLTKEQLREIGIHHARHLLEPIGRNTAPALTLAALAARESDKDPILVVTPADQTIADESAFREAMQQAITAAATGTIVLLGIAPDRPETGYGYIQSISAEKRTHASMRVERFVEKPDAPTAQRFLAEGGYYWNAGMFILKTSVWLKALETFCPDIATGSLRAWEGKSVDGEFVRPDKNAFESIPAESIDYAVMEHCPEHEGFPIDMIPLNAGWSDLGAWDAVWNALPRDDAGNAMTGDVLFSECRDTLVHATHRLVALVEVEDLVVVETQDAVLVANKARSQEVKQIVNRLQQLHREEHTLHRKVHRPWGWYDCIDEGHRFKVKRILVHPKASLSLQMHHHRAEHWVVVRGTAEITRGENTILLSENQSTYIPLGERHRLTNPGSIPLEIIEIQSGSYLGEDDIVRLEDHYGRG
ncbi:MAG: mannose-1-phosphate guanylyltransferase/mannose-6-phosphate isomerase [Magnetococcales bacterium]|nr:mannose-1-phosphate guanylyltransferase/mannose-6-phosphate isomerase [Magnetococcales bacterium]